jgi:hypothetical protein
MLNANPRFPDEDSTKAEPGFRIFSFSAPSTIEFAALSLTEPAKLKASHFKNNDCPKIG